MKFQLLELRLQTRQGTERLCKRRVLRFDQVMAEQVEISPEKAGRKSERNILLCMLCISAL